MTQALPAASIGATVRLLRAKKGWSQADLADHAEVHYRTVQDLERGVRQPRLVTRVRIAEALGIEPAQLMTTTEKGGSA